MISPLMIAVIFNPLRRRVQDFVDRRFYRKKYNVALALKHFSELAQGETNIEQLQAAMMRVVQETMQPEKTGLWLRKVEK